MQRHVALAVEPRRHPFRTHVRRVAAYEQRMRDDRDVRLFVLSFAAFFICISTFIL
ncbi:hypothetical protein [Sphingomonas hengshuiensis]|uniref:hypothetical protein n=1 Tax=Sphingomonas hengshuiensis TaxID=1609977 RepID=UPI000B0F70F6|nr:hypothetical protein [Sphingomonas hengshuiensis]